MENDVHYEFYKAEPENKMWQVSDNKYIGQLLVSFDKKTVLNLWTDYPQKFTPEQRAIFEKECPEWARFFKNRVI